MARYEDLSGVRVEEAIDELQRGRLAAAGRPDERDGFPRIDGEIETFENEAASEALSDVAVLDGGGSQASYQFSVISFRFSLLGQLTTEN
jgi:hypothetical protein